MDKDSQIATVWNILVANEKMPEQVAYNVVKTMFERKTDMVAVHVEAQNFLLGNQNNENSPLPFHPGAIRYFKEKGIAVK